MINKMAINLDIIKNFDRFNCMAISMESFLMDYYIIIAHTS